MKNLKILFTLFLVSNLSLLSFGQFYKFEISSETYRSLSDPDMVNNNYWGSPALSFVTISPKSQLFGKNIIPRRTDVNTDGFIVLLDSAYGYAIAPFLADLTPRDSTSEIRWGTFREGTDTVELFEWYNMGLQGHSDSDFVNFQLKIYQKSRDIKFTYGSSRVTSDVAFRLRGGIVAAINLLNNNLNMSIESCYIKGNPSNPTVQCSPPATYIDFFPDSGTVYTFSDPNFDTVSTAIESSHLINSTLSIYPNPANDVLHINNPQIIKEVSIYSITGQKVFGKSFLGNNSISIGISDLPKGIYLLELHDELEIHMQKIVKN